MRNNIGLSARRSAGLARYPSLIAILLVTALSTGCVPVSPSALLQFSEAARNSSANALAAETDAYIAETYPDFDVLQRKPVANYRGSGNAANWYVLERKSKPGFVMAVMVLKPEEVNDAVADLGLFRDVDFFTTDSVFPRLAEPEDSLTPEILDQVCDLYVKQKPSEHALIVVSDGGPGYVHLLVDPNVRYTEKDGYSLDYRATILATATERSAQDVLDLTPQPWELSMEEWGEP